MFPVTHTKLGEETQYVEYIPLPFASPPALDCTLLPSPSYFMLWLTYACLFMPKLFNSFIHSFTCPSNSYQLRSVCLMPHQSKCQFPISLIQSPYLFRVACSEVWLELDSFRIHILKRMLFIFQHLTTWLTEHLPCVEHCATFGQYYEIKIIWAGSNGRKGGYCWVWSCLYYLLLQAVFFNPHTCSLTLGRN